MRSSSFSTLCELMLYFLRLGATAFGGPAAHIALMEDDCVRRRRWITREQFIDLLGVSNLIPGPTSTELAMHIGYARAGWSGLVVAGVCFIAPAALLVGLLAAVYVRIGNLPALDGMLRAAKPVVVVVVLSALLGLARTAVRSWPMALVAVAAGACAIAGMREIGVLLSAGIVYAMIGPRLRSTVMPIVLLPEIFGYFFKAGSVIFGSGYVLFAILRSDLVERARWLTEAQLLDAIAAGQVTPGPVFTTATFIGYLLGGAAGAVVATIAIFLPGFIVCAISARALERLRTSASARRFLDGVNAAAVALIVLVVFALARHAITDAPTAAIAIASAAAIAWLRVNSASVILCAALVGLLW